MLLFIVFLVTHKCIASMQSNRFKSFCRPQSSWSQIFYNYVELFLRNVIKKISKHIAIHLYLFI